MASMPSVCGLVAWIGCVALSGVVEAADPPARFTLVLEGAGVKDNQTGLIWEQEPDRIHDVWSASVARCPTKELGGQKGWRAPTVDELKTLIDPSQHDPSLPLGHPFSNIKSEIYWTSTPDPKDDIVAWQVSFFSGEPVTDQKSGMRRMWCVLGPPSKLVGLHRRSSSAPFLFGHASGRNSRDFLRTRAGASP